MGALKSCRCILSLLFTSQSMSLVTRNCNLPVLLIHQSALCLFSTLRRATGQERGAPDLAAVADAQTATQEGGGGGKAPAGRSRGTRPARAARAEGLLLASARPAGAWSRRSRRPPAPRDGRAFCRPARRHGRRRDGLRLGHRRRRHSLPNGPQLPPSPSPPPPAHDLPPLSRRASAASCPADRGASSAWVGRAPRRRLGAGRRASRLGVGPFLPANALDHARLAVAAAAAPPLWQPCGSLFPDGATVKEAASVKA